MKFKATTEQIKKVAALAINASGGFGMGMLHYKPKEYKPEEIDLNFDQFGSKFGKKEGSVNIDYYEGRMVKLYIRRISPDDWAITQPEWEIRDGDPRPDYQSWAGKYPTYASFLTAAGITLHVTLKRGTNVHHIIEATFKGVARCLRDAVRVEGDGVPSTKGVL